MESTSPASTVSKLCRPSRATASQLPALPWLAVIAVVMLLAGCGGGPKGPKLSPVKGIVLYNGKPVEGAVVEFIQAGSPLRSIGFTDGEGAFQITSLSPGDGASVGVNQVTVTKRTKVDHPAAAATQTVSLDSISDPHERRLASAKNSVAEKVAADTGLKEQSKQPKDLLPPKYAKPDASGLQFEVKASEPNTFQIVLTD